MFGAEHSAQIARKSGCFTVKLLFMPLTFSLCTAMSPLSDAAESDLSLYVATLDHARLASLEDALIMRGVPAVSAERRKLKLAISQKKRQIRELQLWGHGQALVEKSGVKKTASKNGDAKAAIRKNRRFFLSPTLVTTLVTLVTMVFILPRPLFRLKPSLGGRRFVSRPPPPTCNVDCKLGWPGVVGKPAEKGAGQDELESRM
ncbi:MAG: hypothetical protein HYT79_03150 [Elusimicrobia bacterium]|nr:hypothetical protein [Elusimicrobiota bacterium]